MNDDKAASDTITTTAYFRSKPEPITNAGNIKGVVRATKAEVLKHLESYTKEGSGWRLKRVMALDICIANYQPFRGKSYFPTPKYIPPRTVINVKNEDNRCFEWQSLAAIYPAERNPQRPTKYLPHLKKLNFTGIKFPVEVTDIDKFERQNPAVS